MSRRHNPNLSCEQLTHDLWCMIQKQLLKPEFQPQPPGYKVMALMSLVSLVWSATWSGLIAANAASAGCVATKERKREGGRGSKQSHSGAWFLSSEHSGFVSLLYCCLPITLSKKPHACKFTSCAAVAGARRFTESGRYPKQENTECSPPLLGEEQGKDHQEKHLHATAVCNVCGKKQVLHYILSLAFLCCDMCPNGSP